MKQWADNTSLFSGIVFLLLAGIIASGAMIWRNLLEFSGSGSAPEEVFAGLATQPAQGIGLSNEDGGRMTFGFVVPRGDLVKFIEAVQPPLEAITRPVGFRAVIDVSDTTGELLDKLEKGQVQIAAVTAVAYAKARQPGRIRAILERAGRTAKQTLFLVRNDSPARRLEDLKGTRVAFKSRDSLSGYALPEIELKARGFDPEAFFRSETFTGNARNSVLGLISGEFDVAVVSNTFFAELEPDLTRQLRTVHTSTAAPGGVYVALQDRHQDAVDRVTRSFLALGPTLSGGDEFSGFFSVRVPDPSMYDFLSQVEDDAGL